VKVSGQNFGPAQTEQNYENLIHIVFVPIEITITHFPNQNQKHYGLIQFVCKGAGVSNCSASSRKPNLSCCATGLRRSTVNIGCCNVGLAMRTEPLPTSCLWMLDGGRLNTYSQTLRNLKGVYFIIFHFKGRNRPKNLMKLNMIWWSRR
jgi:hypothetical protein